MATKPARCFPGLCWEWPCAWPRADPSGIAARRRQVLFGAVGWAWGGGLSNMEQTFYVVSDSFPDVLWAFGGVFLVGCLWSGIGSAILSLALTRPRSEFNGYIGPLAANAWHCSRRICIFLARPD